jgi:hypothetical protein
MKTRISIALLLWGLFQSLPVTSQVRFVSDSYFPADMEFRELTSVSEKSTVTDVSRLGGVPDSLLLLEVGFSKYERRVYATSDRGNLAIEIITLDDSRAAFSLLSLLRKANLSAGPPGDFFSAENDRIFFSQSNILVKIRGLRTDDLLKRVATSVGNRIGRRAEKPKLLSHFPAEGYDASSVLYFLGPKSLAAYAHRVAGSELRVPEDVEVAQARYGGGGESGVLSLIEFPTAQAADDFYESLPTSLPVLGADRVYFKRAGPIVSVLAGNMQSETADRILQGLRFNYTIQWIFDRTSAGAELLGVPFGIMRTVVQSLLFTMAICGMSVVAGVAFGFFRIFLRGYAPNNIFDRPKSTDIIWFKIEDR